MPPESFLNLVIEAGCTIRKVIVLTLTLEGIATLGEQNRNMHVPNFIVIGAQKA